MVDMVDQRLLQRAKRGDRAAFSELVDRYRDRIYAFLYRMVHDREEALDLAQETFLRVYRSLHSFRLEQPFKPWLYRIANNLAIDYLRKRKDTISLDAPIDKEEGWFMQIADQRPGPELLHEQSELADYLVDLIEQLPENYRNVILLRHGQDLSYQEIAEILQVPVSTIKTRLFRAREALRMKLVEQRHLWEADF